MVTNFKKETIRDKEHLQFIRGLPCLKQGFNCQGDVVAAHLRSGTDGGMGKKPGDDCTIPLCFGHHAEQHRIGEKSFFRDIQAVRGLARGLYLISGDVYNGINLILTKRGELF